MEGGLRVETLTMYKLGSFQRRPQSRALYCIHTIKLALQSRSAIFLGTVTRLPLIHSTTLAELRASRCQVEHLQPAL